MPAVVRVKRRIDEEPLGAFVLNGKKRRLDDSTAVSPDATPLDLFATNNNEISTILKFAATVQSQDEKATAQIARLTKDEATELAKKQRQQPATNIVERARQEMRAQSSENRFKVVNCYRSIDTDSPQEITIVDIEKQSQSHSSAATSSSSASMVTQANGWHANGQTNNGECGTAENFTPTDGDGYVYDLYLPEDEQQADDVDYTDNYLSVRVYDELVYEDCYNDGDDAGEESEDSNEENYFRNDYPDEEDDIDDDDNSINMRDMRRALENVNLGSDDEGILSSDEDDEEYEGRQNRSSFVFSIDAADEDFEDDVDFRDVDRYGTAYAKYKQRILREMRRDDDEDSDDFEAKNYDENSDSNSD